MKKYIFSIFIVVLSLLCINVAKADSITLKGDKEFYGDTVTIEVVATTDTKMAGAIFPITYDSGKVTIQEKTAKNGFYITIGKNLLLDNEVDVTGTKTLGEITFKVTDSFKVGDETTITLGDGSFANTDLKEWDVKGTSITLKRIEKPADLPSDDSDENDGGSNQGQDNNEGNPLYSCKKIEGVYYNKAGEAVTKEQHEKECLYNTDTGVSFPVIMVVGGIVALAVIYIKNKNEIKLGKI